MAPEISTYRSEDTAGIVTAWNESIHADPMTLQRFRDLVLLDVNFDAGGLRVAREDGQVVGAVYAVRRRTAMVGTDLEPELGWILFFFVIPRTRRKGVGRALLGSAMDWLAGLGATKVHFSSYTPNYILPGLDAEAYPQAAALLASLSFERQYEAVAMDRLLVDYAIPDSVAARVEALRSDGYHLGGAEVGDLAELVTLAGDHFNPDWARAIREAVVGGLPLENILVARDAGGILVGWAMHGTYEGLNDRFGPFGVREDQRGTGLGKVLLHLTLHHMKARGSHSAWFLWTDEESPAGYLYLASEFHITRRFGILAAPTGLVTH